MFSPESPHGAVPIKRRMQEHEVIQINSGPRGRDSRDGGFCPTPDRCVNRLVQRGGSVVGHCGLPQWWDPTRVNVHGCHQQEVRDVGDCVYRQRWTRVSRRLLRHLQGRHDTEGEPLPQWWDPTRINVHGRHQQEVRDVGDCVCRQWWTRVSRHLLRHLQGDSVARTPHTKRPRRILSRSFRVKILNLSTFPYYLRLQGQSRGIIRLNLPV